MGMLTRNLSQVNEAMANITKYFTTSLVTPTADVLETVPSGLWGHLRSILETAVTGAKQLLKSDLHGYIFASEEWEQMYATIRSTGLKLQDASIREVAHHVLGRMKDRFVV